MYDEFSLSARNRLAKCEVDGTIGWNTIIGGGWARMPNSLFQALILHHEWRATVEDAACKKPHVEMGKHEESRSAIGLH